MSSERIWLLINQRRTSRGKEPVTLTRVQRALRFIRGDDPRQGYQRLAGRVGVTPLGRWDLSNPSGGRPPYKSDNSWR
jgi:hypothetical protein